MGPSGHRDTERPYHDTDLISHDVEAVQVELRRENVIEHEQLRNDVDYVEQLGE